MPAFALPVLATCAKKAHAGASCLFAGIAVKNHRQQPTFLLLARALVLLHSPPLNGEGAFAGACCGERAGAVEIYNRLWLVMYAQHEVDAGVRDSAAGESAIQEDAMQAVRMGMQGASVLLLYMLHRFNITHLRVCKGQPDQQPQTSPAVQPLPQTLQLRFLQ